MQNNTYKHIHLKKIKQIASIVVRTPNTHPQSLFVLVLLLRIVLTSSSAIMRASNTKWVFDFTFKCLRSDFQV